MVTTVAKLRHSVENFQSAPDVRLAGVHSPLRRFKRTVFGKKIPKLVPQFAVQATAIAVLKVLH
jgi:hypothetical protein